MPRLDRLRVDTTVNYCCIPNDVLRFRFTCSFTGIVINRCSVHSALRAEGFVGVPKIPKPHHLLSFIYRSFLSLTMYTTLFFLGLLASIGSSNAAKSSGCGQPIQKGLTKGKTGKSNDLTFGTSDSATRRYLLHIPEAYDISTPTGLIWSFAGRGKKAEHQEKITKLSDSALNPGYIVIYPQAETNSTHDTPKKGLSPKPHKRQSTRGGRRR